MDGRHLEERHAGSLHAGLFFPAGIHAKHAVAPGKKHRRDGSTGGAADTGDEDPRHARYPMRERFARTTSNASAARSLAWPPRKTATPFTRSDCTYGLPRWSQCSLMLSIFTSM